MALVANPYERTALHILDEFRRMVEDADEEHIVLGAVWALDADRSDLVLGIGTIGVRRKVDVVDLTCAQLGAPREDAAVLHAQGDDAAVWGRVRPHAEPV